MRGHFWCEDTFGERTLSVRGHFWCEDTFGVHQKNIMSADLRGDEVNICTFLTPGFHDPEHKIQVTETVIR